MKKSLLLIPLLLLGSFTFASDDISSFPAFPMTIYGNIQIWSSDLNGWNLKVYNSFNQELASYNITQNGKYWSDSVTIEPLLLNKFDGRLTFKVFYNGKIYIVDSIDDSNKLSGCPSKSSITFVSENCRYDITLKEESASSWSHSSGSGGKRSSSSTDTVSSNNVKSDTSKVKTETDTHNAADKKENEKVVANANNWQNVVNSITNNSNRRLSNLSQWNPSDILGNWYTRELNNAYTFSYDNWITTVKNIKDAKVNWPLTRIGMAKMLSYYAINVLWKIPDTSKNIKFNDVSPKLNAQYNNAVVLSYQLWIMWQNMKNNEFRPNDEVSRAEFVTALSRMLYWMEDGKWNMKYYEPHMARLYNEWIISKADPKMKEKRWYVMTMLMRSAG